MTYPESSPPSVPGRPRLTRSRDHVVFGGVCAGLAEFYGWRRSTVRLLFVLSCILPGPQAVAYLILWLVIPRAPGNA
jgi:phage shock protein C